MLHLWWAWRLTWRENNQIHSPHAIFSARTTINPDAILWGGAATLLSYIKNPPTCHVNWVVNHTNSCFSYIRSSLCILSTKLVKLSGKIAFTAFTQPEQVSVLASECCLESLRFWDTVKLLFVWTCHDLHYHHQKYQDYPVHSKCTMTTVNYICDK